jgi:hypothetical protein
MPTVYITAPPDAADEPDAFGAWRVGNVGRE